MTRRIDPETRVQRGGKAVRRGHETSDAPTGWVVFVMTAFGLLLLLGIGVGLLLQDRFGRPTPSAPLPPVPQRLLVHAPADRQRIEAAARQHIDEARLRGAMRDAATRGWDGLP